MNIQEVENISGILSDKNKKIVLVTHVNPDGDAIGASLGLYEFLLLSGFSSVLVITPNDFTSFLKWLPGNENILTASNNNEKAKKAIYDADVLFCLDFNDPERAENLSKPITQSKALTVLLDHHPQPVDGFDYVLSDTTASSTAEIVYKFIKSISKDNLKLNNNIAACLYTGIMTDTGSFSYGCSNPDTFSICAELVKTGINPDDIHRLVYDTYSVDRIKLLGYCLSKRLTLISQYNTAYICLTQKDLDFFNHQEGDTEGIVNYALSIRNIDLAALFIEKKNHVKLSIRSIGNIDVNYFARNYFNGGGHKNAAGGKYFNNITETIKYFENVIPEFRTDVKIEQV